MRHAFVIALAIAWVAVPLTLVNQYVLLRYIRKAHPELWRNMGLSSPFIAVAAWGRHFPLHELIWRHKKFPLPDDRASRLAERARYSFIIAVLACLTLFVLEYVN